MTKNKLQKTQNMLVGFYLKISKNEVSRFKLTNVSLMFTFASPQKRTKELLKIYNLKLTSVQ